MVTMISVWCVSTPVWWPGEDAGEERGLRNCCRVLLGLVTEPWPANDGRNDGANLLRIYHVSITYLSCIYHVSIVTIHAAPAGAGRGRHHWPSYNLARTSQRLKFTPSCCIGCRLQWEDAMKYINIFSEKLWASILYCKEWGEIRVKYHPSLNMILLCVCKHFWWLTDRYIQLYD